METVISSEYSLGRIWRSILPIVAILVLLLCAMLIVRRLGGALTVPLDGIRFTIVVGFGLVSSWLYRFAWLYSSGNESTRTAAIWLAVPTSCLILGVAALTASPTPAWSRSLGWVAILISEVWWWGWGFRSLRQLPLRDRSVSHARNTAAGVGSMTDLEGSDEEPGLAPGVTQQLTRSQGAGDVDSLYGLVRATIGKGELSEQIHIAFCPPFKSMPQLRVFVVEGLEAMVQVSQLESFGARLEVRLPSHSQCDEEVLIEFDARHEPSDSNQDTS